MLHARIIEKKTGNRSFTYYAGKTPWKMPATLCYLLLSDIL